MNAVALTVQSLSTALNVALTSSPVTVDDICALIHQGKHTRRSLDIGFDIPPETEINRALRRIDHLVSMQVRFRADKHWAYDNNKLIALVQCRDALGLGLLIRSPR